jgi:hypothetical protein
LCCNVGNADSICGSYQLCWCTLGACAPGSAVGWPSCDAAGRATASFSCCYMASAPNGPGANACQCNSELPDSGPAPCGETCEQLAASAFPPDSGTITVVPSCPPP